MTGTIGANTLVLEGVLLALALVHFAWLGLIAGGSTLAVAVDALANPRLRPVADALAASGGAGLRTLAWLEVTGVLLLVLARALVPELPQSGSFWAASLLPLLGGVGLAGTFRSLVAADRFRVLRPLLGLAGVGFAVGSAFVFWSGAGVLLRPESWPTAGPPWRFLLNLSGTGRFAEFTLLSLAATGILATVRAGRLEGPEAASFARRLGGRLAVACLVLLPLASIFTHFNLPAIALSPAGWGTAAAGVALAGFTTWLLTSRGPTQAPARPGLLLGVTLSLFATLPLGEQLARRSALRPVVLAGVTGPEARLPPAPPAPAPSQQPAAPGIVVGGPPDASARGREVFDRVCGACHRFDARRVGPPLGAVLPKYRGHPERLRAFLKAPVKIDPAYPAMPPPKASDEELEAVAAWLLEEAR